MNTVPTMTFEVRSLYSEEGDPSGTPCNLRDPRSDPKKVLSRDTVEERLTVLENNQIFQESNVNSSEVEIP